MKVNGFPNGMNNRQPDYALPNGTLRNAVNTDIDNQGNLRRREGYEKVASGINMHSGFSCEAWSLIVNAGRLKIWNDDDTFTDLMAVQGPVCYHFLNNIVYFSDGVGAYKLLADGTVTNWGVTPPNDPILSSTSGSLAAGTYLAAVTPIGQDGFEHGSSEVVSIEVDDNSGIVFTLPAVTDPQVDYLRVYLSTANGEVLYGISDVAVGTATYTVTENAGEGVELETLGCTAMPAGSTIDSYRGILYVVSGDTAWHSDPQAYDRMNPDTNFIQHSQDIDLLAADTNGIWMASDKTYFYSGAGPGQFTETVALEYGAVPGKAKIDPSTNALVWYSKRGVVRASGGIANLQEANIAAETGDSAAVLVREFDGLRQVVASVTNAQVSKLAAGDFLEMEVVRKAG
jgi:hypothetical protein